jgi:circadian clock protein KaiB
MPFQTKRLLRRSDAISSESFAIAHPQSFPFHKTANTAKTAMSASKKTYILKLYVAGNTPSSMRALKMLNTILEEEFQGVYALKVIDVLKNPQLAEEDKILATPTLSKILPPPVRKIIGDLSDREKVLIGLDLLYDELQEDGLFI